jgi:hypothetical protein
MADRFLCDSHLGKLAKWLRILGYDTLWTREDINRDSLRKAEGEGRIARPAEGSTGREGTHARNIEEFLTKHIPKYPL